MKKFYEAVPPGKLKNSGLLLSFLIKIGNHIFCRNMVFR